jgi:hypothetical protein
VSDSVNTDSASGIYLLAQAGMNAGKIMYSVSKKRDASGERAPPDSKDLCNNSKPSSRSQLKPKKETSLSTGPGSDANITLTAPKLK